MDLDEYQKQASKTATFEGKDPTYIRMYLSLGVAGESGELIEKIKKVVRNDGGVLSDEKKAAIKHEIGDVLWYLSQLARSLDIPFSEAAQANLEKLADRAARGVIKSEGDVR